MWVMAELIKNGLIQYISQKIGWRDRMVACLFSQCGHAYSRYLMVKEKIESNLPSRGGKMRVLTKEDLSQQSAIFLRPKAQFDHLVSLPDSADRARAIIEAMESIETDYVLSPVAVPFSYLYMFVTTNEFVGHLVNHVTEVNYPAVRPDYFERAIVLIPSNQVLDLFHEKTESSFRLIAVLEKEIKVLTKARDLLLPRLMNGEVAV